MAVRVIGLNAMAHSTITNIEGTFAWRGIEIKTGSSDLLVRNIKATYQAIPGYNHCIDAISLGNIIAILLLIVLTLTSATRPLNIR